jgi:hypothetical protein
MLTYADVCSHPLRLWARVDSAAILAADASLPQRRPAIGALLQGAQIAHALTYADVC